MQRTPLFERHARLGARMIDFGGWELPVRYTSEKDEHMAVRTAVGIFDVSHMGEIFIEGPGALDAVQRLFSNDATSIANGQAMYTGLLKEDGTFVDDCVVYRYAPEKFLVCVNASNRQKDADWISALVEQEFADRVQVRDESEHWGQIAVQGPRAAELVARLAGNLVHDIAPYHFREATLCLAAAQVPAIVARTGYTGEDGFELYLAASEAGVVWDALLHDGASLGVTPCGLACRDTLRLEAGMALYGNDIDEAHTPLDAGLNFIVKLEKATEFVGAAALRAQKARGITQRLRGLVVTGRGIPRHGYRVLSADGTPVGVVTSGTQAPYLNQPIAMAYIESAHSAPDNVLFVEIRGAPVPATVTKLPFYRRAKG